MCVYIYIYTHTYYTPIHSRALRTSKHFRGTRHRGDLTRGSGANFDALVAVKFQRRRLDLCDAAMQAGCTPGILGSPQSLTLLSKLEMWNPGVGATWTCLSFSSLMGIDRLLCWGWNASKRIRSLNSLAHQQLECPEGARGRHPQTTRGAWGGPANPLPHMISYHTIVYYIIV